MDILSNKELVELFNNSVLDIAPNYFLEIGAYTGEQSIYISEQLPDTKVFAYEANPYNYAKYAVSKNNLQYIHQAVSNYTGNTTFYLQTKRNPKKTKYVRGNNSLLKRNDEKTIYEEVTVKCDTLDNMFHDPKGSFALWIDAEGHGFEILEKSVNVLTNTKIIFIEVESKEFWKDQQLDTIVIDFLQNKGFTLLARDQEYPEQYNIIFIK